MEDQGFEFLNKKDFEELCKKYKDLNLFFDSMKESAKTIEVLDFNENIKFKGVPKIMDTTLFALAGERNYYYNCLEEKNLSY